MLKMDHSIVVYGRNINFKGALHKVENVSGNKNGINFKMVVYTEDMENAIAHKDYYFVPSNEEDSPRWDKQCYEHAKSLEEYRDSIDV